MTSISETVKISKYDFNKKFQNGTIKLNTARNGLKYVIKSHGIKEIYIPYYTCPAIWKAARSENCKIKFYHIDKNFLPNEIFGENAFILYTNYFGVCGKNVEILSAKYPNLIVDNAHAFYAPNTGLASFNSARKFFRVPDGSYVFSTKKPIEDFEQDTSSESCFEMRKNSNSEWNYNSDVFIRNEIRLNNQPIKTMSKLTQSLLASIDFESAKQRRLQNFQILHKTFESTNELNINLADFDVPMVYPYLIKDETLRKKLDKNRIYIDTYWSPLCKSFYESQFQKYLLPLPIDQSLDENYINHIIEIIRK